MAVLHFFLTLVYSEDELLLIRFVYFIYSFVGKRWPNGFKHHDSEVMSRGEAFQISGAAAWNP